MGYTLQCRACVSFVMTTDSPPTGAMASPLGSTSATQRSPRRRRDTIVSFLYRIHRDALRQTPGDRVYYEDHNDFNEAFDNDNETIRVSDLGLRPSQVLFNGDPGAYKAALIDHIAERDGLDDRDNPGAPSDDAPEGG